MLKLFYLVLSIVIIVAVVIIASYVLGRLLSRVITDYPSAAYRDNARFGLHIQFRWDRKIITGFFRFEVHYDDLDELDYAVPQWFVGGVKSLSYVVAAIGAAIGVACGWCFDIFRVMLGIALVYAVDILSFTQCLIVSAAYTGFVMKLDRNKKGSL